ncbi:MAG: hypothetical protein K0S30_1770 [Clostridia bacterium]|jgi:hypothetical protein|nr:hypothetical protein [Clostridia bacterium]
MSYSGIGVLSVLVTYLIFLAIGIGVTFAIILFAINKSKANRHLERIEVLLEDIKTKMSEKEDK